jgi:hypothetical protein
LTSTSRGGVPGIERRYRLFRSASGSERSSEIVYG